MTGRIYTVRRIDGRRVLLEARDGSTLAERRDALPADLGVGDVLAGVPRTACGECYRILHSEPGGGGEGGG